MRAVKEVGGPSVRYAVAEAMVGLAGGGHKDCVAAVGVAFGSLATDRCIGRPKSDTVRELNGIVLGLSNQFQDFKPLEVGNLGTEPTKL